MPNIEDYRETLLKKKQNVTKSFLTLPPFEDNLLEMNPFIKLFALFILLLSLVPSIHAKDDSKKVNLAYDMDFDMRFDNREFYKSAFSSSMTIFAARVTPSIGLSISQNEDVDHKIMMGADVMKNFGGNGDDLIQELTFYYNLKKKLKNADMTVYAGIFPRRKMIADYSPAFFSDSLAFYDNNLEGILIQFDRPSVSFEIGCDWMGQYGKDSRERFMVFSGGAWNMDDSFISLGYSAYLYHFANSFTQKGVVDNVLLNPYIRFDFADYISFQKFSIRFGWLQAMQNDRVNTAGYVFPGGCELDIDIKNYNFGIHNRLFCGKNMMPYYNTKDNTGAKYGSSLYMGDPFYRLHDNGSIAFGLYDRLEAYYEPDIKGFSEYVKVRVTAAFHFNGDKYCGSQQMVQLTFNLQELLNVR